MKQGYVCLNDNIFSTLLAITAEEQSKGLMHQRDPLVMSFIYPIPQINKFWMHQTPNPLDIVFCCDGKVSQICYGEPYSTQIIGGDTYSDLIVEFPLGTTSSIGLKVGHPVQLIKPNFKELKKILARHSFAF